MIIFAAIVLSLITFVAILGFRYRPADHSQYDVPDATLVKSADEVSAEHLGVLARLAEFHKSKSLDVKIARENMESFFGQETDAQIIPASVEGIAAEWIMAEGADPDKRLLYIHGGAFRIGSPKSHRYITSEISKRAGVAVLAIDYRMQPEYKIIVCHKDAQTAYKWILNNGPNGAAAAENLFVAGDSAGGNLTLSVIAWARDNNLTAADGAIVLAPLTDFTLNSPSWKSNRASDPFLGPGLGRLMGIPKFIIAIALRRSTGKAINHPDISPLLGDLSNLPATLLQVSKDEMLFDDAHRYANKAISSGGDITLQVWPTMVHVFQAFGPELPEALDALDRIADFISTRIKRSTESIP